MHARNVDGPRIVTVSHFYPAHGGGLEKVAEKIVGGLAERGFRICWFSSDTDGEPASGSGNVTTVPVPTSNIVERLTQLPYPIWSPTALPRLWREIGNADVLHVHEHLYFPSILAVVVARIRRRPVVITQHMGALTLGSRISTWAYEAGARILGKLLFPAASRSVFISHNVRKFFGRQASPRAQLIHNGVDTHLFMPASATERMDIRTSLKMPTDRKVILFVGRFVRKKGLHRVVDLATRFPNVLWVLVGSGPEEPKDPPSNVLVAGRIEHEQLSRYYLAADLLILPSAGEGFPLVVQEALCCGTGVLSTDEVATACPDATDLIRFRPVPRMHDDAAGWESALREVLETPGYLDDEARRLRALRARELWSWEHCVSEYAELFRDVTGYH